MLYVTYILLICALVFMFGARFCSLCARKDFRKTTVSFPESCSEWALNGGCTYITLNSANCYNSDKIPSEYVNMWLASAQDVNIAINKCVDRSLVAKFQSPKNGLDDLDTSY